MAQQHTEATAPAEEEPRTVVWLGNRNTISIIDGERVPYPGKRCTTVVIRPDATLFEAGQEIAGANGVWQAHSDGSPAWVAARGPLADGLLQLLAAHFKCEVREPDPETGA